MNRPAKRLPCKYFYDDAGSQLFDRICDQPEYYPTRTESRFFKRTSSDGGSARRGLLVIEYGSGSSIKTRLLLDALDRPAGYLPVDIAGEHLERSAAALAADNPGLKVMLVWADFTCKFALPSQVPTATAG